MQTYNLSDLGKRAGKRKGSTVLLPEIHVRLASEREYYSALIKVVNGLFANTRDSIIPAYIAEQEAMRREQAITRDVDRSWFTNLTRIAAALVGIADSTVANILNLESQRHTSRFMADVKRVIGIDVGAIIRNEDLDSYIRTATSMSTMLIRNMAEDTIKRIETAVYTNAIKGNSVKTLREDLQKQFGISKRRAQLIARDQMGKFNGHLTQIRQQQAGVTHYHWRTSHDERVRPRHRAIDGNKYKWGEPTGAEEGLPPGEPVQCRCWAAGIVEFGEVDTSTLGQESPRDKVLGLGRDGNEHMVVMSGNDEVTTLTSGDKSKVDIPSSLAKQLTDPSNKFDVHHNHPIDVVSFSPYDLLAFRAMRGVKSFFAHTESVSFKISRTDLTGKISEKLIKELTDEYDKKVAQRFMEGLVSIYEVENNRPHYILKKLHARRIVRYETEGKTAKSNKEADVRLKKVLG